MSFFQELKRRNVFRVGAAYALAAWVLLQIVDFALDAISAPNWIVQVFILAAAVGLPVVLIFSWVFEMTPEGVKRESDIDRSQSIAPNTGRKLDRVIIVFLTLAVVVLLADRFMDSESDRVEPVNQTVEVRPEVESILPARNSIAVLPFVSLSSGQDDEYFADGLTEEILNSLSQLPELLVTARTSAFHFKGKEIPIQEIAEKLGVSSVVEGSVRRSGDRLRVTAQLIRAADGFHLWSENYDSTSDDTIAVQEDIAEKIATAMNVVLDENKREAMRQAGLRNVEAFIAMQKGIERFEAAHGDPDMIGMLGLANTHFERVQTLAPEYPLAYQLHSDLYIHQLIFGATQQASGLTDPAEVELAWNLATADIENAWRVARTPQERNNAEIDLAFISGDWRGMRARIERFAAEQGCSQASWVENISLPFGYAKQVRQRSREFTVCDPMGSGTWRSAVRSELWAGDLDAALDIARKGSELAPGDWLTILLVSALVARGELEAAESEITSRLKQDTPILATRMMVASARGDRDEWRRIMDTHYQGAEGNRYWELTYFAWGGDRARANEVAATIDAHVFGSQGLATIALWCLCGAPWDLDATPEFAADLEESGLSWPPASPISFPLKTW